MTTRRDFLKGMLAAAIATGIPSLPAQARETLASSLADRFALSFEGATPVWTQISQHGNGWLHLSVGLKHDDQEGPMTIRFVDTDGGNYFVDDMNEADTSRALSRGYRAVFGGMTLESGRDVDRIFSTFVKLSS